MAADSAADMSDDLEPEAAGHSSTIHAADVPMNEVDSDNGAGADNASSRATSRGRKRQADSGDIGKRRAPGRPDGTSKSKQGTLKGKRQCQGCFKMFDAASFPINSTYCLDDKQALNNIYNAAKSQNELDWYHATVADAQRREALLRSYHSRCPPATAGKKRKSATGQLMHFKEEVRSVAAIYKDNVGEMMTFSAYAYYKMKLKNGGWSYEQAKASFEHLMTDPNTISDRNGPEGSRERIRVVTKDLVTFREGIEKAKGYQINDRAIKDASQEDIAKASHKMLTKHDCIAMGGGVDIWICFGVSQSWAIYVFHKYDPELE